jgi:4a-hydroxytetrahydrobiopterin dehydratase
MKYSFTRKIVNEVVPSCWMLPHDIAPSDVEEDAKEATMAATSEVELLCSLPGWQHYGNRIEKTFNFDAFSAAARFVGRLADDAAVAGRQPAIDLRCDRVTVAFAPRDDSTLTQDDVAVAGRIQRLMGDHRHPIGRAGPWSPRGTLAGIRPRPVGQTGP